MPILKGGYGAVRNLCGKSGARFPPSTVSVQPYSHPVSNRLFLAGMNWFRICFSWFRVKGGTCFSLGPPLTMGEGAENENGVPL